MRIKIAELRRATNVLFDHLEKAGHLEIELDKDFYWSIPDERLYVVYENPSELTMGQLSDDLVNLEKIGSGEDHPIAYGLVWLSSVLRFIGAKIIS